MKFYCEWEEEDTVINRCCGWIEADSEEEAVEKIKEGDAYVEDRSTWDILDSVITNITNIYEE
jgi:hypothetical protein